LERANGIRFPPTIAALRVAGFEVSATGTSGVGWIGRYSEYAVPFVT
jgi:hypothetical protein